jgi:pyridoxamine 5'-phosphate oxidase
MQRPDTMLDLSRVRQEYMRAGLDEKDVLPDPLAQFERWFADAVQAELPLPNAMSLATVSQDHKPSSRLVLLKGVDHGGFVFYTNMASRKGREISVNAHASLLFGWLPLERQVRIDGTLAMVSAAESDAYFATRPLGSRHAAIASPQSEVVASRAALEALYEQAKASGEQPPRPPHWGGYRLIPEEIEFWQGRENRLHDRVLYRKAAQGWTLRRLAP